jgi:hypothetical protein
MDSMIEDFLKGHGCPDKTKTIQHYIKDDKIKASSVKDIKRLHTVIGAFASVSRKGKSL